MQKQKIFITKLIIALFVLNPFVAHAQVEAGFNPNKLIEDKVFSDTATFGGPAGIQKFLESKNSVLANTSPDFLAKLKEPTTASLKKGLDDVNPDLTRLRTAAELIWDAGKSTGLNPQVILVILQKEQGLITTRQNDSPEQLQKALDRAMGLNCGDDVGCWNIFPGFYYQIFGNFDASNNRYLGAAKTLMKSFTTPGGRGPVYNGSVAKVGDTIEIFNTQGPPNNAPASQMVTLENSATAALYRYTPHVYNGNYNFWKYMNQWFRYPNGTLISGNDGRVYIIQNGTRQIVPNFVAQARGLNLASAISVSPTELESYPQDKIYGPADNTVAKIGGVGQAYVFIQNMKRPASDFVLGQRGLEKTPVLSISAEEAALFESGPTLTPSDGTVLKGKTQAAIYLVENGNLKLFSPYTFAQRKLQKQVKVIPNEEIDSYPKSGFVAPLSGSLVRAENDGTVYLIMDNLKHPVSGQVFKSRKFSFKNVAALSKDEISSLTTGSFATPGEKSFFKISQTGALYIFKEGTKHSISNFVAKQRGITADYSFNQSEAADWPDGIAITPKDNTLVQGDKDGTVYVVLQGQLRGLTAQAFKNKRYNYKNVKILPQAEIDNYGKGDVIEK